MEGLNRYVTMLLVWLKATYIARIKPRIVSERGDTNFISILIILGIVVVVAGLFIGYKDQIVERVDRYIQTFLGQF